VHLLPTPIYSRNLFSKHRLAGFLQKTQGVPFHKDKGSCVIYNPKILRIISPFRPFDGKYGNTIDAVFKRVLNNLNEGVYLVIRGVKTTGIVNKHAFVIP
jgi:hypothetical protein